MKNDDQLKQLFQRANRDFEFDVSAIEIPQKRWVCRQPNGIYISMAASIVLLVSGSLMFPVAESILEWSSYSFEYYQRGIELCMSSLPNNC